MVCDNKKIALANWYVTIDFFGDKEKFALLQSYDAIKHTLCKEHGVVLLVVPYHVKDYLLSEYIKDLLNELGIPLVVRADDTDDTPFMTQKYKSDMLADLIKDKNGELLSGVPLENKSLLTLKCDKGHEWTTNWGKIRRGSWCHSCAHIRKPEVRCKISAKLKEYNDTNEGQVVKAISHEKRSETMAKKKETVRASITEKKCRGTCGLVKPVAEFGSKSAGVDGLQPYCRPCQSIAKKLWKQKKNGKETSKDADKDKDADDVSKDSI